MDMNITVESLPMVCNFSLHVVNFLFPKSSPGYGEGIYWGPLVFQEASKTNE